MPTVWSERGDGCSALRGDAKTRGLAKVAVGPLLEERYPVAQMTGISIWRLGKIRRVCIACIASGGVADGWLLR
jgi:hypothetical protein